MSEEYPPELIRHCGERGYHFFQEYRQRGAVFVRPPTPESSRRPRSVQPVCRAEVISLRLTATAPCRHTYFVLRKKRVFCSSDNRRGRMLRA